jgi:hypothetical protein
LMILATMRMMVMEPRDHRNLGRRLRIFENGIIIFSNSYPIADA